MFQETPASKLIGAEEFSPLKTTGSFLGGTLLPPATSKNNNYGFGGSFVAVNSIDNPHRLTEDVRSYQRSVLDGAVS
jgi:hypothetical protein